jgi:hypothetical protein
MKLLRQVWDLLFGVLLIGGAPLSVIGLWATVVVSIQWLLKFTIPIPVGLISGFAVIALAIGAFVVAIRFRIRRRILPSWLVVFEIILGVAWAGIGYAYIGFLTYSANG